MKFPWKVVPAESRIVAHVIDAEGTVVAIIPRTVADLAAPDLGRASLVAAAPDLVAACETARGAVFALVEMLTAEMAGGDPDRDLRHLNCRALGDVAQELTAAIAKAESK